MAPEDGDLPGDPSNYTEPGNDESKKDESSASFLQWLAKLGPAWSRAPAIIASILVATVPTLLLLSNAFEKWVWHSPSGDAGSQLQMAATTDATSHSSALMPF
jgi:hypothetical protein